jgi:hypothetical protein
MKFTRNRNTYLCSNITQYSFLCDL